MHKLYGHGRIAEYLGVHRHTVRNWREVFDQHSANPCPEPDAVLFEAGPKPRYGWTASGMVAWKEWFERHTALRVERLSSEEQRRVIES